MGFFRTLWQMARAWPDPGMGLRTGSGSAVLVMFFVLLFSVIGGVLVMLGFDLNDVDAWLAAQGGWLDAVFTVLFKALLVFVCLFGAIGAVASLFARKQGRAAPQWGAALIAAVVAYFAGAGLLN